MSDYVRFLEAVRALQRLRAARVGSLPTMTQQLVDEVVDIERQMLAIDAQSNSEQERIGEAFVELLEIFGSDEEVWVQYPDAAGLLLALRTPIAREHILTMARLAKGLE